MCIKTMKKDINSVNKYRHAYKPKNQNFLKATILIIIGKNQKKMFTPINDFDHTTAVHKP